MNRFEVTTIGTIRSPYKTKEEAPHRGKDEIVEIEIDNEFVEGLQDIEQFSHLHVFYFLHESRGFSLLTHTPWDEKEHGLFATRSPNRPTPIGYSVVELVEKRGNILKVRGLDAIDGTPVIDIKPYSPGIDARPGASRGWFPENKKGFTPRVYTWKTQVTWKEGKEGVLHDAEKEDVRIGCPPEFGGKQQYWSPEHLFISSVEACILTTFIDLLAREKLEIIRYESHARGNAQLVDGTFRFTEITVTPVVLVGSDEMIERIGGLLDKAKRNCLVSNSSLVKVTMKPVIRSR